MTDKPTVESLVAEARELAPNVRNTAGNGAFLERSRTLLTQLADALEQAKVYTSGTFSQVVEERDAARAELVVSQTRQVTLNANFDKLAAELAQAKQEQERLRDYIERIQACLPSLPGAPFNLCTEALTPAVDSSEPVPCEHEWGDPAPYFDGELTLRTCKKCPERTAR